MEEKTHRVLVVDDDADLLAMHSLHLVSLGYDVLSAENGQVALERVKDLHESIDIILSDIVMPVMEGHAFCQAVKSDSDYRDIPFVFISSLGSLEEKIKGFEVGADDCVAKPVSPVELDSKLKNLLGWRAKNKSLPQHLSEENSIDKKAFTYSSVLGSVLEFYRSTLNAVNFAEIADLLFEATNNYGLRCCMKVFGRDDVLSFASEGVVSPLEEHVMDLSRSKGQFFHFNARTIINYADFSLLIKNMPIEDVARYGTIKKLLKGLCDTLDARVQSLMYADTSIQTEQVINLVTDMEAEVDKQFGQVQRANINVMDSMLETFDEAMLDLAPNQKERVRAIMIEGREKSERTLQCPDIIYDRFEELKTELEQVLENK